MCDSNYILLALKYLNQDCEQLLRLPPSIRALDTRVLANLTPTCRILAATCSAPAPSLPPQGEGEGVQERGKVRGTGADAVDLRGARRCRRAFEALSCVLHVLLVCCETSRGRVRTLLTYKAPVIFRVCCPLSLSSSPSSAGFCASTSALRRAI